MLCPICKKQFSKPASDEPRANYLPFCSDRCQLIDLGRWLDGKYQVPVNESVDDLDSTDDDVIR